MARHYQQGKFSPINPQKIIGDPTDIVYRSGWELKVFTRLDVNPNVVKWGSEVIVIPYRSPKDNMIHRYFPDLIVVAKAGDGSFITTMIEIKPKAQSVPPVNKGNNSKRYLMECLTYAINQAKWRAAEAWCEAKGIRFTVMTEDDILYSFGKK